MKTNEVAVEYYERMVGDSVGMRLVVSKDSLGSGVTVGFSIEDTGVKLKY